MDNFIPVIGIILIAISIYLFKKKREFIANSVETEALVVELIEEYSMNSDSYNNYIYYPVFEFKDIYGNIIRKKHNRGSYPPAYQVNYRVKIQYQPNNSENFVIASESNMVALGVLLFGLLFVVGSVIGYLEENFGWDLF
ncbi:MAG: DUF3592 domain-containing protein [Candidatus Kapabacteria bacterium]|nr:DUF3592 domain-containing protein [Ignavibacteriota bacterium]MCW5886260.1 DUF3592 domain-containing protein [Candidatus Kapabacteria bacterium]